MNAAGSAEAQVLVVLLVAAPLAFLLALFLQSLFLGAVKRSMRRSVGAPPTQGPAEGSAPAAALALETVRGKSRFFVGAPAAIVYFIAGIAYAGTMMALFTAINGVGWDIGASSFLLCVYFWPAILAIGLPVAVTLRGWLTLFAIYAAVIVAIVFPLTGWTGVVNAALGALAFNTSATVLLLLFTARPIRAVGPLTLVFSLALIGSLIALLGVLATGVGPLQVIQDTGARFGLDVWQSLLALLVIVVLSAVALAWIVLQGVGALYRAGAITDQTFLIDATFLLFALDQGLSLAVAGSNYFFVIALAGFAAYKITSLIGFAVVRGRARADAPRLLLLRVFSLGKRSERLFDGFAKLWRRIGSIRMIAGPDLATTTIEPHEFLDFLHGRLSRRFIDGPERLEAQIRSNAEARRYDGRYGVSEFFCHDDTWKLALARLVADSDAVLMDLRGFTPSNKGCAYEIEALLDMASLAKLTFVIDKTTDEDFLRATFAAAWAKLAPDSPNRSTPAPAARLYRLGSVRELLGVVRPV